MSFLGHYLKELEHCKVGKSGQKSDRNNVCFLLVTATYTCIPVCTYLFYVYHLFVHVVLLSLGSCGPANLMPINDACVCPDSTLRLNCTTVGNGITAWQGTAFGRVGCSSLLLQHSQFNMLIRDGESRFCNDVILIRPLSVVDDSYTSQLTMNASVNLNGSTIVCEHDSLSGGDVTLVGTYPIVLTTGRERERERERERKLCSCLHSSRLFSLQIRFISSTQQRFSHCNHQWTHLYLGRCCSNLSLTFLCNQSLWLWHLSTDYEFYVGHMFWNTVER